MSGDFLEQLDAAIEGRCACGCDAVITPASPSAWFAAETCAGRWHTQSRAPGWLSDVFARIATKLRQALDTLTDVVGAVLQGFADDVRAVAALFSPYGDVLAAGRRPGPARPPTRIDPCTGFGVQRRGRPLFRPPRY